MWSYILYCLSLYIIWFSAPVKIKAYLNISLFEVITFRKHVAMNDLKMWDSRTWYLYGTSSQLNYTRAHVGPCWSASRSCIQISLLSCKQGLALIVRNELLNLFWLVRFLTVKFVTDNSSSSSCQMVCISLWNICLCKPHGDDVQKNICILVLECIYVAFKSRECSRNKNPTISALLVWGSHIITPFRTSFQMSPISSVPSTTHSPKVYMKYIIPNLLFCSKES